jgi:hypothetical protein
MSSASQTPIGKLEPIAEAVFNHQNLQTSLTLQILVYNGLNTHVTLADRSGVNYIMPPGWRFGDRAIYICRVVDMPRYTEAFLGRNDAPASEPRTVAEMIVESMRRQAENQPFGGNRRQRHFFKIHEGQFHSQGGSLYIPELDIVLAVGNQINQLAHPFTISGMLDEFKHLHHLQDGLNVNIILVDNSRSRGDRYVNLLGAVHRVPRVEMAGKPDGVYIAHPIPPQSGGIKTESMSRFLTFEEAEKELGLYKTIEEAQTHGYSKEALERENLQLKREAAQRAFEREQVLHDREDRSAERKAQRDEVEHVHWLAKFNMQSLIEGAKLIGSLAGAAASIFVIVGKLKDKK